MPLDLNHDRGSGGPLQWNGSAYQSGQPLLLPGGSVSVPALAIGEADDGFYQVAANDLGLSINGAAVYRWTASAFLISNILQLTSSTLSITSQPAGGTVTGRTWTESAGAGSAADAADAGGTGGAFTIKSGAGGAGSALQAGGNSGALVLDVGAIGADGGGGAGSLGGISIGASGATTTFGGVALHPNGSVSAPSISFSSAPLVGFYQNNNSMILALNGSGNVWIWNTTTMYPNASGMDLGTASKNVNDVFVAGSLRLGEDTAQTHTAGKGFLRAGDSSGQTCLFWDDSNGTDTSNAVQLTDAQSQIYPDKCYESTADLRGAPFSTSSDTFTNVTGVSTVTPVAGEYLCIAQIECHADGGGITAEYGFSYDGAQSGPTQQRYLASGGTDIGSVVLVARITADGSKAIGLMVKDATGNANTIDTTYVSLALLRVSAAN